MARRFITYCLLFFLPVLLIYIGVEYLTNAIPSTYLANQKYIEKEGTNIEALVLGSSHLMNAVNAEWLNSPSLNLASGNQHHDTDLKLYLGIKENLPALQNVVLEVSYSHFELPPNTKDFWKNSLYYKYYGVNCFERTAYFKDRLVFLSNPPFFSERIEGYYISKKSIPKINQFGFNTNDGYKRFNTLNYNKEKIDSLTRFRINTEPNFELFEKNTSLFFKMLDRLKGHNMNIVICSTPMYATYLQKRNPEILKRRDSIFDIIKKEYPNVKFLKAEADTINFSLKQFWNHSHLNPTGAKVFTHKLDSVIKEFK